jgi:hypothetical protein
VATARQPSPVSFRNAPVTAAVTPLPPDQEYSIIFPTTADAHLPCNLIEVNVKDFMTSSSVSLTTLSRLPRRVCFTEIDTILRLLLNISDSLLQLSKISNQLR